MTLLSHTRKPFLALFVALFACGGCNDEEPVTTSAKPFAGVEVTISVPANLDFPEAWDLMLDEWSQQTGAVGKLREYEHSTDDFAWQQVIEGDSGNTESITNLLVFPITEIAEITDAEIPGLIPEVQLAVSGLDWLDYFQGLRENIGSIEGKPAIVPLSCPVLVCYYRSDLLEAAGLSPPRTWEEYGQLVEELEKWAPGLKAVEPWGPDFRATMFLARVVAYAKHPGNFSFYFDISSGKPLIDTPGVRRGFEMSLETLKKLSPDVTNYSPADCRRELLEGRAALAISFETGPGNPPLPFGPGFRNQVNSESETRTKIVRLESQSIGFFRLPGAREVYNYSTQEWEETQKGEINFVTLTGFGGLGAIVSEQSDPDRTNTTWNLLSRLSRDDVTNTLPGATKSLCRFSHADEAYAWVGRELLGDEPRKYLRVVRDSLKDRQLVAELPVVGRNAFRQALSGQLQRVIDDPNTAQTALQEVSRRWKEISEEIGTRKVLNSYRRSLGLFPLRVRK